MRLSYFIARRYLFAKKSHNVINIISLISAIGIVIGSCALVLVLSVYNGFEEIVKGMYDKAAPDIVITSDTAKFFRTDSREMQSIYAHPQVAYCSESVEENVFIKYGNEEGVALLKGVGQAYAADISVRSGIVDGEFRLYQGEIAHAVSGIGLSRKMKINPRLLDPLEVYFPDRSRNIDLSNPSASLNKEIFFPSGIYASGNEKFNDILFVPLDKARSLVGISENETGIIEVRLKDGADAHRIQKEFKNILGGSFEVLNKYQQNKTVYKMMRIEKAVIFLIMLFIIIVISCNVFGSLTMLIIEKKEDIRTLQHLGASDSLIRRIFFNEGRMIIIFGAIIGIALGVILALIQQYAGVIEMPGNFVVKYYPVVIKIGDILLTFAGIALVGIFITFLPTRKTLSKIL